MSGEILYVLGSDHDDGIERAVCHVAADAFLTTAAGREIEQWFGAVHAMLPEGVRECSTRVDGFMEGWRDVALLSRPHLTHSSAPREVQVCELHHDRRR